jgi:methionyl-tRNA formyltransferase
VSPLRIAYFGTPEFAVPGLRALIASTHDVVALVSQPDRPRGRGHKLQPTPTKLVAAAAGIPVLQPTRLKDDAFADALRALSLDLAVVAAYGRIIPDRILEIPRLGMINIHASLLPKYRGAAPIHRAVINGDTETGVTIMRVVSELDAGPAFAVERIPIGPDDTTPEVERALAEIGAKLAVRVVGQLAEGSAVEVPQNHWSLPASEIHNRVRGFQPWPLVSVAIDGVRCSIYRTSVRGETTTAPPGTVIAASNGVLAVAAGDGRVVRILEIQPEGKRVMSARDFLSGRRVQSGDRLP